MYNSRNGYDTQRNNTGICRAPFIRARIQILVNPLGCSFGSSKDESRIPAGWRRGDVGSPPVAPVCVQVMQRLSKSRRRLEAAFRKQKRRTGAVVYGSFMEVSV